MQRIEHLTAVIEREGEGFVALCPELDIARQGDTVEEANSNLREALGLFFETMVFCRPTARTKRPPLVPMRWISQTDSSIPASSSASCHARTS